MTIDLVKALHRGDHVKWNDPDHGIRSRVIKILQIEVDGDMSDSIVKIWGEFGDYIEVFAWELE